MCICPFESDYHHAPLAKKEFSTKSLTPVVGAPAKAASVGVRRVDAFKGNKAGLAPSLKPTGVKMVSVK
jgi:hypothetical protein